MIGEKQLQDLLATIAANLKTADSHKGDDKYTKVEWNPIYKDAVEQAEEIEVHACGDFPKKLIGTNFPNETNEEREYRERSFQPITEPYWKKALMSLNRIWAEQNYSIEWEDDKYRKYFTSELPIYKDVRQFFKSLVTKAKIDDANGVLALEFDLPVKQSADGEFIIDDSKELEPTGAIYESEDVLMFEDGEFCLLMSEEKTVIDYAGRKEKIGYVLYAYDDMRIYRIIQVGKKIDWQFQADVYYEHNLGELPVWKLKGTPEEVKHEQVLYDSYFSPALPHLNEAVIIHSTNKSVRNKLAYPQRVYYDQDCKAPGCTNGTIYEHDHEPRKCSACNGTGKMRYSPFTDYVHQLPTATSDTGADKVAFPGLTYVSMDGTILKDNEEVIDKYLSRAFSFLNIDAVPDGMKAGLGQDATATKTKIDRDEQFVSILNISNELFHLMQQFISAAYRVRYNKEECPIVVSPPTTFDLTSADELTGMLETARKAGMPKIALGEMMKSYTQLQFSQDNTIGRVVELALYADALFSYDPEEIAMMAQDVEKWQRILHINFVPFLQELKQENLGLFEMDDDEIKAKLIEKAKAKVAEIEAMNPNSAGNIMKKIAAPTP